MFWKKKKPRVTKVSLSPAIRDNIHKLLGSKGLPAMPRQAQKAFELSIKSQVEPKDFIEIIESDEGLTARVLKIANSAFFGRKEKCETIKEAVVIIGGQELKNLLCANALTELFPSSHPLRTKLWQHDIAVGIATRLIAQRNNPRVAGNAFIVGLMHDIGKLLLLQRYSNDYEKIFNNLEIDSKNLTQAEEDLFLCNHCELGQVLGEKWNFSEELIDCIAYHHQTWENLELQNRPLIKYVKAADILVHYSGIVDFPKKSFLKTIAETELDNCLKTLSLSKTQGENLIKEIDQTFRLEEELYC